MIQPKRIARMRGGSRGVLWADSLHMVMVGGQFQGYGFFHFTRSLTVTPAFGGLVIDPSTLNGQHRAWSDGSVEWLKGSEIDLIPADAGTMATFQTSLGPAVQIYYYY